MYSEVLAIFSALFSNDSWEIKQAISTNGAWIVGLFVLLLAACLVLIIYRYFPIIERHLERSVMVWSYLAIAIIIFVEVFRRFVLNEQAPWSTTLPPFLFLIMTWFGCSYNVKLRTHLAFSEFRSGLPRIGQLICLLFDAVLWLGLCWIVVVTASRIVANSAANFQILLGTDNVLQWWFLIMVPIAFILMAARVLENVIKDISKFRNGEDLLERTVIGGD